MLLVHNGTQLSYFALYYICGIIILNLINSYKVTLYSVIILGKAMYIYTIKMVGFGIYYDLGRLNISVTFRYPSLYFHKQFQCLLFEMGTTD